jgi:hypothetical protein
MLHSTPNRNLFFITSLSERLRLTTNEFRYIFFSLTLCLECLCARVALPDLIKAKLACLECKLDLAGSGWGSPDDKRVSRQI